MKTKTSLTKSINPVGNSLKRSSRQCGTVAGLLIALVLVCFALAPQARAVCRDGCDSLGDPNQGNTFLGEDALTNDTAGNANTAIGYLALKSNTTGEQNTAIGDASLISNTGSYNTAVGRSALALNTTGNNNTASGSSALYYNQTGSNNTAYGQNWMLGSAI